MIVHTNDDGEVEESTIRKMATSKIMNDDIAGNGNTSPLGFIFQNLKVVWMHLGLYKNEDVAHE